jgi:hypothetical protein
VRRLFLALVIASCAPSASAPFSSVTRCDGAEYRKLDFWLGEWEVVSPSGAREGSNLVSKSLDGCAVTEDWVDAHGGRGASLFYFDRARRTFRQVWATSSGGWKEKREATDAPPGSVRFAGVVPRASGGEVLDRTTLTPLPDGRVRQVIEQSADGGVTWRSWEGIYMRRRPACDAHGLDFWLGDWDLTIRTKSGASARGMNRVRATYAGCVIDEDFHAEGPDAPCAGRSLSRFVDGRWRQTWVDDQGSYLAFTGGMSDGKVILYGEPREGAQMRMVFADIRADALVWTWERSEDKGAHWSVQMTIEYTRRVRP